MRSCQPHGELGLTPIAPAQQASRGSVCCWFTYFPVTASLTCSFCRQPSQSLRAAPRHRLPPAGLRLSQETEGQWVFLSSAGASEGVSLQVISETNWWGCRGSFCWGFVPAAQAGSMQQPGQVGAETQTPVMLGEWALQSVWHGASPERLLRAGNIEHSES